MIGAAFKSKQESTIKVYLCHFFKWKVYADLHGLTPLPALDEDFSCFLVDNVGFLSYCSLKMCISAICFFHRAFNLRKPCEQMFDGLIQDYLVKFSKKTKRQRNPVLIGHMEKLFNTFDFEKCSLYYMRSLCFVVISFFGFLRFSDFVNLKVSNIVFTEEKVEVKIEKSKTDRGGFGQQVIFDIDSFPAKFLLIYYKRFRLTEFDSDYMLFMSMKDLGDGRVLLKRDTKMTYDSAGKAFKKLLQVSGIVDSCLTLHSLRIGGATESSRLGVADFRVGANGRWKSDVSRILYQRDLGVGEDSVSMVLSKPFSEIHV